MHTQLESQIVKYFTSFESRAGYRLILGNARHFGYYDGPLAWPFAINKALRAMEKKLLKALALPPGSKVLDAGAGYGFVAIYMAKQGGLKIECIDIAELSVRKTQKHAARAGCQSQINATQGSYQDLSTYEDSSFDGAYTMETFVFSPDPVQGLREFFRILRPGGVLVQHEGDHVPGEEMFGEVGGFIRQLHHGWLTPAWKMWEYGVHEEMLRQVGFVDIELVDMTNNIAPMLFVFWLTAFIPYHIIMWLGWQPLKDFFLNTIAGYEMCAYRHYGRYVQLKARKPYGKKE